jgi:hypothetical protein
VLDVIAVFIFYVFFLWYVLSVYVSFLSCIHFLSFHICECALIPCITYILYFILLYILSRHCRNTSVLYIFYACSASAVMMVVTIFNFLIIVSSFCLCGFVTHVIGCLLYECLFHVILCSYSMGAVDVISLYYLYLYLSLRAFNHGLFLISVMEVCIYSLR